jgi:enamine deaminase RidA (YjgF/YER057c/UK114 family)
VASGESRRDIHREPTPGGNVTPLQLRRTINLPGRSPSLPFSDAVLVGDTLYISGRIGIEPVTGLAPPDIDQELRLLFDGFSGVLAEAEMTWGDLVWVQVFSPDLTLWDRFNVEYVKHFDGDFPARAFLGSAPLLCNGRFEMMGIAVKANND